jgi:phage-related protein
VPLDVFAPSTNPSNDGTQRATKRRVNAAQFGDGYSQRSGDGLNVSPRTISAQWSMLDQAEAENYEAFFDAHAATPFLWAPPGETLQRKWTAGDSTVGYVPVDGAVSLSCPLTEVFDL